MAALNAAAREMAKLVAEYGVQEFRPALKDIVDYTERLARASIAALPDGTVEFTEWNDDDGAGNGPIKLHVRLTVEGDEITADFSGTAPQMGGAVHPNFPFTVSCTYAALRTVLQADMPNNAGFYRPINVIAPEGVWVNPRFPAAVGARGQGGYRVRSLILGALAQLIPDRMTACPGGSEFGIAIAGKDEAGKRFIHLEFHNMTGHGGGPDHDGQDGGPYCLGNLANTPVEFIEAENPLSVEAYGFIPDTGGAGKYRGALGIVRQYRLLADEAMMNLRSDRHLHPCWGLFGGKGGAVARSCKISADGEEEMPSKFVLTFKKGDALRAEMAGSGGYGDPLDRDPAAVGEDVRQEKVSIGHALAEYGVVVDAKTGAVDGPATETERRRRGPARPEGGE
jgi:N-methylhydantoinase B